MTDMQDRMPAVEQGLEKVGIENLKTLVKTSYKGREYRFVPTISLAIDLPKDRKGAHMSRLIEAITECVEQEAEKTHLSLEKLGKSVLEDLKKRHPYGHGLVEFKTDLVIYRKTPVTRRKTGETHGVEVSAIFGDGRFRKRLTVIVYGNTSCPHAMEYAGKPHIQRAVATLTVETDFENPVDLEDLIAMCESSFSSPVYTLLKTEDEASVVERMHENPLFVEDVCRNILGEAKKISRAEISVKVVSQESIHRHDVFAEGSLET